MRAQSAADLLRALPRSSDLAPAWYLTGPEDVLKEEVLRALLDRALDPSLRDFNLDQRSAQTLEPEEVEALCGTLPMMSDRRVVVIRDVEAWKRRTRTRAAIVRYLERPQPETLLVLWQGSAEPRPEADLAAKCAVVTCDALSPGDAQAWVRTEAARLGVALPDDVVAHLVQAAGTELAALRGEVKKLSALPEGTPVTLAIAEALVGVRQGETVLDWRDAVLRGDAARASALLEPVLAQSGVSGVRLVSLLGTALLCVRAARARYDDGMRGRGLVEAVFGVFRNTRPFGLGEWRRDAAFFAECAPQWPRPRLRAALQAALRADRLLKETVVSDERGIVLSLSLELAASGRRAA